MATQRSHFRDVRRDLLRLADPAQARFAQRYFKTGPGEYGHGDKFRGIRGPALRRLARQHRDLTLHDIERLLASRYHEDRLVALLVLIERYQKGDDATRRTVFRLYLDNTDRINNWDLVDVSAPHIVGPHLDGRTTALLTRLARSDSLWERRIAMLATFYFIRQGEFAETLRIAELLLDDHEDLIHKATGWMLREVGKRDRRTLERFLERHLADLPRTALRYAIERFPERRRRAFLNGRIGR